MDERTSIQVIDYGEVSVIYQRGCCTDSYLQQPLLLCH